MILRLKYDTMHKSNYWLLEIVQIGKQLKSFENAGKVCPVKYPQLFADVGYVSVLSCFGAFSHNKSKE